RERIRMELGSANLSQELERLRRILLAQRKATLLGSLIGNLAHDLNNPLTTVSGNIELLQHNLASEDPKVKKRLESVQHGAKRMREKLRSLQLLTRIGRADERFDLNQLVADVGQIVDCLPKEVKVKVEYELANEQIVVSGNSNQVAHALLAVIDNGI